MRKLRSVLEYLAYRAFALLVPLLPRGGAVWLGRRLGGLALLLDRRNRRTARENLARALPERSDHEELMRESFRLQGVALLDMLWSNRLKGQAVQRIVEYQPAALEHLLSDRDRGLVVATGHFGSWEMLIHWGAAMDIPRANFIARPVPNPWIDRDVRRQRERSGNRLLYRERAILKALSALRAKEIVCSVIDIAVPPAQGGIFVDFLGIPALTSTALPLLAVRRHTPLIFLVCRPVEKGRRYVIEGEVIEVRRDADRDEEVARLTAEMSRVFERRIREHPEAWMWGYKRWKWRPNEQLGPFPDYSSWVMPDWG